MGGQHPILGVIISPSMHLCCYLRILMKKSVLSSKLPQEILKTVIVITTYCFPCLFVTLASHTLPHIALRQRGILSLHPWLSAMQSYCMFCSDQALHTTC